MRIWLSILCAVALGACTVTEATGPKPAFDIQNDIAQLSQQFGSATSIHDYYTQPETKERRDAFISGRLTLYNLQYIQFISQFAIDQAQLNAATDILKMGVGLATTLVAGEATKSILGAISTGLVGAKVSIDKNFFQEKTVPALVSEMNARRKEALIPILEGIKKSPQDYPLTQAIVDLHDYYEAGTFLGATQSIQKTAGAREAAAEVKIEQLRTVKYSEDDASRRIGAWLWKGGIRRDANGQLIQPDATKLASLRTWMTANVGSIPIETFLVAPALASARQKAVDDLQIPKP